MRLTIFLVFLMITTTVHAAIYINENKNGTIEYTDTPTATSTKVEVPSVNTITPKSAAATSTPAATPASGAASSADNDEETSEAASTSSTYQKFEITSPTNGTNIQNQPVIPVEMSVEPNMKPGDKIQLMLDDKPAGTPTGTIYQELGIVERGTHTLYAVIKNNKDEPIKQSSTVTFFVHRNSVITSPATPRQ